MIHYLHIELLASYIDRQSRQVVMALLIPHIDIPS